MLNTVLPRFIGKQISFISSESEGELTGTVLDVLDGQVSILFENGETHSFTIGNISSVTCENTET